MTCVALLRLPSTEVAMIRSFMDVVAARGLAYMLAENAEQAAGAELVIVDADNRMSTSMFDTLLLKRRNLIAIRITKHAINHEGQIWIQRPLNSMKLLTALGKADLSLNPDGNLNRSNAVITPAEMPAIRALVIDDSAALRKQLVLALREQGVQVFTAECGESGLHILSQNQFDLIILDVVLPGADGYQICKTIKKNRQIKAIPVVMLTSKSSPFDRVKGSLAGCDVYLTKPVEFRRLIEVVNKFRAELAVTGKPVGSAMTSDASRRQATHSRSSLSAKTQHTHVESLCSITVG